jgi:hypothetical protein
MDGHVEARNKEFFTLERKLIKIDCGQVLFDGAFEISRGKYIDFNAYFVRVTDPLLSYFSKAGLTEEQSRKLYKQIIEEVPAGRAKILFKPHSSFELVY